jgi:GDSL-like Lipase/Acylhydrolase family
LNSEDGGTAGRWVVVVAIAALGVVVTTVIIVVATPTRLSTRTVPVVGDSITVLAHREMSAVLGDAYRADVHAKSGQRIDQMLPTLARVLRDKPFAVVVNLGTNDALQAQTHPEWRNGFADMVGLLAAARCVVLTTISTVLPGTSERRATASEINLAIAAAVATHRSFHVVDWNAAVHGANGARLLVADRVHPSPAGQLTLAVLTRAALDHGCLRGATSPSSRTAADGRPSTCVRGGCRSSRRAG